MKGLRHHIRNFFGFSRSQTNGFVALLLIISFALFSKPVYHSWISSRSSDFSDEKRILDSLTTHWESEKKESTNTLIRKESSVDMFPFNPNTVKDQELEALGFPERLSKNLQNYRSKGGTFRLKSDLKKLYGMDSVFYLRIYPFIQLPEASVTAEKAVVYTKKETVRFNLNEADTSQFETVYGIGPVLARRIIKYRVQLGGFVRTDQLYEVYGLDSVVVGQILKVSFLPNDFAPHKFNINEADEKSLASHPYFSKKIARAIVTYRFQHGKYQSVDDLRKIEILDQPTVDRIYPYVTIE